MDRLKCLTTIAFTPTNFTNLSAFYYTVGCIFLFYTVKEASRPVRLSSFLSSLEIVLGTFLGLVSSYPYQDSAIPLKTVMGSGQTYFYPYSESWSIVTSSTQYEFN